MSVKITYFPDHRLWLREMLQRVFSVKHSKPMYSDTLPCMAGVKSSCGGSLWGICFLNVTSFSWLKAENWGEEERERGRGTTGSPFEDVNKIRLILKMCHKNATTIYCIALTKTLYLLFHNWKYYLLSTTLSMLLCWNWNLWLSSTSLSPHASLSKHYGKKERH